MISAAFWSVAGLVFLGITTYHEVRGEYSYDPKRVWFLRGLSFAMYSNISAWMILTFIVVNACMAGLNAWLLRGHPGVLKNTDWALWGFLMMGFPEALTYLIWVFIFIFAYVFIKVGGGLKGSEVVLTPIFMGPFILTCLSYIWGVLGG